MFYTFNGAAVARKVWADLGPGLNGVNFPTEREADGMSLYTVINAFGVALDGVAQELMTGAGAETAREGVLPADQERIAGAAEAARVLSRNLNDLLEEAQLHLDLLVP